MARLCTLIAVLASALTLLFVPLRETSALADAPLIFHDPLGRFSFTIPPGWTAQRAPSAEVVVQFVADPLPAAVNVATEQVPLPMTLDEYASVTIAAILRAYPDFQTSAAGIDETTLGGRPARRWQLTGTRFAEPLVVTQYAVLRDATAYVLTFVCPEADVDGLRDQVAIIVETFAFPDDGRFV